MVLPPQEYFDNPDFAALEAVFHEFVAQGEGRNITWLVQRTKLPTTTIAKGMVKGLWQQRIHEVGQDAAKVVRQQLVGDVAGLNSRDVSTLTDFIEASDKALLDAIRDGRVSPATLAKINFEARKVRREILGIGSGGEEGMATKLAKLLEGSVSGEETPFKLDPKQLEAPSELPAMPGMTSDADEDESEDRELDDDEKEQLRG